MTTRVKVYMLVISIAKTSSSPGIGSCQEFCSVEDDRAADMVAELEASTGMTYETGAAPPRMPDGYRTFASPDIPGKAPRAVYGIGAPE